MAGADIKVVRNGRLPDICRVWVVVACACTALGGCGRSAGPDAHPSPAIDLVCGQADRLFAAIPGHESAVAINGTAAPDIESRFPARSPQGGGPSERGFETTAQVAQGEKDPAAWAAAFSRYGMQGAWVRAWRSPAQLEMIYLLADHREALAFQRWAGDFSCHYANVAYSVPGVPGSIGFQIRWASGGFSDQVSFVRGPRRYLVVVPSKVAPRHPNLVVELAREANRAAG